MKTIERKKITAEREKYIMQIFSKEELISMYVVAAKYVLNGLSKFKWSKSCYFQPILEGSSGKLSAIFLMKI